MLTSSTYAMLALHGSVRRALALRRSRGVLMSWLMRLRLLSGRLRSGRCSGGTNGYGTIGRVSGLRMELRERLWAA